MAKLTQLIVIAKGYPKMRHLAGLLALLYFVTGAQAQTIVPGDPYAGDPVGIVANPCPSHPAPQGDTEWQIHKLHGLTRDFGGRCRYRTENAALKAKGGRVDIVFIGDSITERWRTADPSIFTGGIIDRGISGQTSDQMLVRFRQDVLDLHPRAVHIMAGTNDIAGNTGATTFDAILGNIRAMVDLARAHDITVIIASVPSATRFYWNPAAAPALSVAAFNKRLHAYAARRGLRFVDYFAAMAMPDTTMKDGLSIDGVHPSAAGYAVMRPLALAALARLRRGHKG